MNRSIRCLLILAALLVTSQHSFAKNWYIDAERGHDGNTGNSPKKAWQTLAKANTILLEPGDSLLFKAGTTYDGQLSPQGSGSLTAPVYIGSYGQSGNTSMPRINAGGQYKAAVFLNNKAFITVADLECTNTGTSRIPRQSGVLVKAENCGTLQHITLRHLYIHDVNGSLVKNQGGGQGIQIANSGKDIKSRFDYLLIENCHISRTERNGIIFNSGYWNRTNWFPNLHVVIRGNLLEEVPGDGIVPLGCEGALVEHNRMRACTRLLPDTEAAAGIWPWSSDHTVIQYNEVSDHKAPWDAQGFDCDYNCVGTIIQYNYSHDNEGGFLLVCCPSDQRMPFSTGNDSSIVRYNLSVNDGIRTSGAHAGFSPVIYITGPVTNTDINHNTVIVYQKPAGCDPDLIKMDNWGGSWPLNTSFTHNTFYVKDSASIDLGKDKQTVFKDNLFTGNISHLPIP